MSKFSELYPAPTEFTKKGDAVYDLSNNIPDTIKRSWERRDAVATMTTPPAGAIVIDTQGNGDFLNFHEALLSIGDTTGNFTFWFNDGTHEMSHYISDATTHSVWDGPPNNYVHSILKGGDYTNIYKPGMRYTNLGRDDRCYVIQTSTYDSTNNWTLLHTDLNDATNQYNLRTGLWTPYNSWQVRWGVSLVCCPHHMQGINIIGQSQENTVINFGVMQFMSRNHSFPETDILDGRQRDWETNGPNNFTVVYDDSPESGKKIIGYDNLGYGFNWEADKWIANDYLRIEQSGNGMGYVAYPQIKDFIDSTTILLYETFNPSSDQIDFAGAQIYINVQKFEKSRIAKYPITLTRFNFISNAYDHSFGGGSMLWTDTLAKDGLNKYSTAEFTMFWNGLAPMEEGAWRFSDITFGPSWIYDDFFDDDDGIGFIFERCDFKFFGELDIDHRVPAYSWYIDCNFIPPYLAQQAWASGKTNTCTYWNCYFNNKFSWIGSAPYGAKFLYCTFDTFSSWSDYGWEYQGLESCIFEHCKFASKDMDYFANYTSRNKNQSINELGATNHRFVNGKWFGTYYSD